MTRMVWCLTGAILLCPVVSAAQEKDKAGPSADELAVRKATAAYVEAYNAHDAKAVAALWSPEAVYTSRTTGEQVVGREAIEKEMATLFEQDKKAHLEVLVDSVQFMSPNVAMQRGTATVTRPDGSPEVSRFSAVVVKRDGQWLLDRVTEDEEPAAPPAHEQLKQLAWLIGSWGDEDEHVDVKTEVHWSRNENFIIWAFTITSGDSVKSAGIQVIGWDPAKKEFRSWVFQSDGGFGQGHWEHKGKQWFVHETGTLPDGRRSSAVNILTQTDDNSFTWRSIDRELDGRIEPNIDEVRIVRKSEP